MTIRILTVCTGNICRSPMAEQLLRVRLNSISDVLVESAGSSAMVGWPMDEQAAQLAGKNGAIDVDQHVARQLSAEMVRDADVIFAMAREHRKAVVQLIPRAARKTFTLREFARIVTSIEESALRLIAQQPTDDGRSRIESAIELVADERGMLPPVAPEDDDVVDPFRQSAAVYAESADQLVPAVDVAVEYLQGFA
ncbi:low molecular weight phosphatase family protein [Paramicrobacterium fandaimingii]|uniref:arsenate reductase/protein-tyrosine-phosphatase family protein n=1 Tax=Paramicrobacterium fandaimingii TaxID=2708079 RepID=UPI001421D3B8|nr:low molecular weight phosphatase family protein [Microbacterium fandaimingii]